MWTFAFLVYNQVLIVFTDGKQTTSQPYTELSEASQGIKNKGIEVYAVGIGKGVNVSELQNIASRKENVLLSTSFKEVINLTVPIRRTICAREFLFLN